MTRKIRLVLTGPGGELDRQEIETSQDMPERVSEDIFEALKVWAIDLAPGDTIKITEV